MPSDSAALGMLLRRTLRRVLSRFLFSGCVIDSFYSEFHTVVEALQLFGFFLERVRVEEVDHVLHDYGDGVTGCEVVVFEEHLEYGFCDEVL